MTDNQNDLLLMRYLLGALPPGETERLDQLSIADDEFASQLSAAENDLVDAYVRGDLPSESVERFDKNYLSSPKRREKLKFAETFYAFQQRATQTRVATQRRTAQKGTTLEAGTIETEAEVRKKSRGTWGIFSLPRLVPQWGFAGAAFLLLIASAYLFTTSRQLREQASRSEAERATLAQHEEQLQHQLEAQTVNSAQPAQPQSNQPAQEPVSQSASHLKIAAFVLIPSLRGDAPPPSVIVEHDTELVVLKLELEATDFSSYRVAIEDSATRQDIYHSTDLKPLSEGDKQTVSFAFNKKLLKQKNYLVQVEGVGPNGSAEPISSYPFKAVVK